MTLTLFLGLLWIARERPKLMRDLKKIYYQYLVLPGTAQRVAMPKAATGR